MFRDSNGHEWEDEHTEHPFLTPWKCKLCSKGILMQDGEKPYDKRRCENARSPEGTYTTKMVIESKSDPTNWSLEEFAAALVNRDARIVTRETS